MCLVLGGERGCLWVEPSGGGRAVYILALPPRDPRPALLHPAWPAFAWAPLSPSIPSGLVSMCP